MRTPSQIVRVTSAAGQRDDVTLAQRLLGIGCELGLDSDHAGAGTERLDRRRDPRDQAAAADAHDDGRDPGQIARDLEPDRSLAGDDPRVVERRDVLERARVADLGRHALSLLARVGAAHDLGAERLGAGDLHGSSVLRHHDRRGHAVERGSGSNALGVIPARVGHDAALDRGERRRRKRVERAAELERAGALEALRLDVDLALARQPEEGSAHRHAAQAGCCGLDVGEGDGKRRRTHVSDRTRARIPSRA